MVRNVSELVWTFDSGYTDHIVNDDTVFENLIVLKNALMIRLDDGLMLKATKICTVKRILKVYDTKCILRQRYEINLIRFSKVTKHK